MRAKSTKTKDGEKVISLPRSAMDNLPSGAVRLNKQRNITYANKAFCRILGVDSWRGLNIRDVFPDERNFAEVSQNLKKRFDEGVGNDYCVEITRESDGSKVPVNIIAVPETDKNGKIIGSFAFIRDLTVDTKMQQIHRHIETERDWRKLLQLVAREVGKVIPYDWFSISVYSEDMRHVRMLFADTAGESPAWGIRWFELPEIGRKLIEKKQPIIIDDFDEFFRGPEWRATMEREDTRQFLKMGFRSSLWYPVLEGRLVAGVGIYSKRVKAYGANDQVVVETLPVRRAVSMALHYIEREERDFSLQLIRDIAASDTDSRKVAQLLVDRIAAHYDWGNVSFFRVNEAQKRFELVAQKALSEDFEIPEGYTQELDKGVLGCVYKTQHYVNSGNVLSDEVLAEHFRKGVRADVKSEVAIPIIVDGKVCAIFNSEHTLENAYSDEERRAVEAVLREVSSLYKRLELQQILSALQQSTRDAIIRTDSKGSIIQVNKATTELLEFQEDELIGTPLSDYFVDAELAKCFMEAEDPPGDQVELRRKHGDSIAVLLSGSLLPVQVGGRVYTASDLSWRKRVERLEFLKNMYQEIGTLAHMPLSLCFSWLKKLLRNATGPEKEFLEKINQHLAKVRLTFDRASLFEREGTSMPFNPVPIGVPYILNGVIEEMPAEDGSHLDLMIEDDLPPIRGDVFQLSFCFGSVLSHLLQFVPEEGKVRVRACRNNGNVEVKIQGKAPKTQVAELGRYGDASEVAHALFELAVGGDTLNGFMKKHGGRFEGPHTQGDEQEFAFVVPATSHEQM